MSTVTDASGKQWATLHNMTEKAKAMYEVFCEARAISRQTPEGQAHAAEFFEVGKEQGDFVQGVAKSESTPEKNAVIEYNANGS
jgi:hypothetical protein